MTFLNPLLLLGLVAAAIPLIIHLFNFRRPKRVDFSTLAFLKELQQTTMQRVRIKQWLLLALRTLAIASLVLAFARPTLTGSLVQRFGGNAPVVAALVVDNSRSMGVRDQQGEYLAQARTLAARIIGQMQPGDEVWVLSTADTLTALPDAYRHQAPALDAVAALETRTNATIATRVLVRAAALLDQRPTLNKELYLLSDLQQRTLADTFTVEIPDDVRLMVIPVGNRPQPNVGLTGVQVVSRIVEAGQPVEIEATATNYGTEAVAGVVAGLFLEGERVAQASADLPPGVPTLLRFTATPQQRGWLAGQVQIEADAFEYDNTRYFTLHVPARRRVLVVRGDGQATPYLDAALSAQVVQDRMALEVQTLPETALAAADLGTFGAVVLVGVQTLSSGETAALARYVEAGGGLLLFPHEQQQTADLNALLAALGGGRFAAMSGTPGAGTTIATFDQVDLEHPLFEGVLAQPQGQRTPTVERPTIYAAMGYTPGTGTEQTLVGLTTGTPFLQELRHGDGSVLVQTVAPDLRWSDLPVRGLFLPLLYRTLAYLSASGAVQGEAFTLGEGGELRLGGVGGTTAVALVSPDGETFTPLQRTLPGAILVQTGTEMQTPGVYEVKAGDVLLRRIAFNLDARESDLTPFSASEAQARLQQALGREVAVLDGSSPQRLTEALTAQRTGAEVWNVFLVLALVCLVAEMLVARQWRPETVTA